MVFKGTVPTTKCFEYNEVLGTSNVPDSSGSINASTQYYSNSNMLWQVDMKDADI